MVNIKNRFRSILSISIGKVNLKDHLQQITSEISRARMALSGPLRRRCLMRK